MEVQGTRVDSIDKVLPRDGSKLPLIPGSFFIRPDSDGIIKGLFYQCPCGCQAEGYLPFRVSDQSKDHPTWVWDGNEDKPTLGPSILRTGGCKWHGYLIAGVWRSVDAYSS